MAKFFKDNYTILLISMLVGLLCWMSEQVIEANVRLTIVEHKLDKLVNEMLIIKDHYKARREQ